MSSPTEKRDAVASAAGHPARIPADAELPPPWCTGTRHVWTQPVVEKQTCQCGATLWSGQLPESKGDAAQLDADIEAIEDCIYFAPRSERFGLHMALQRIERLARRASRPTATSEAPAVSDEEAKHAQRVWNASYNLDAAGHSVLRAEESAMKCALESFLSARREGR